MRAEYWEYFHYREMWGLVTVGYVVVLVRLGKSMSLTKGLRSLRIATCLLVNRRPEKSVWARVGEMQCRR